MNKSPLVSIITPSLNQGFLIRETIKSVITQDYPNIEYIVIDGGSSDGTIPILQEFQQHLYWISEPDRGQSDAINKGWKLAKGEIISWLNSDDTLLPGAVSKCVESFQTMPEISALYGDCDYIGPHGAVISSYPTQPFNYKNLVTSTVNFLPQPATFVRRSLIEKVGLLDDSLHFAMDLDYWLRAGLISDFRYLPERLATLRLHSSAKSLNQLHGFASEIIEIYQRFFSRNDLPESIREAERLAMRNAFYRAADCAFWAGQPKQARNYAFTAWKYAPLNPRGIIIPITFGKFGRMFLQWKSGNPYQMGINE
jgi:glycosyltransferase involved in cell wall biosynthesis